jgi:ABC-type nitrate/sulfonate/bicarbonate transport system substrate-binding protein
MNHSFGSLSRRSVLGGGIAFIVGHPLLARAQTNKARIPVAIVNTTGNATLTLQQLVKQEGFLEDFGLEAQSINVADGSKLMGALLSGSSDICLLSGFSQVLPAVEKGAKMKVMSTSGVKAVQTIYTSRPEIKAVKDLVGKTIGTGSPGALLHQLMVAVLRKKGIDPGKVTFANIGSSADVFRAVSAGTVDAGPGQLDVYDQQEKYKVHSLPDGNFWTELPEFTYQGSFASQKAIDTKREALVRTLAAYLKLFRFIQGPNSHDAFVKARITALGAKDMKQAEAEGDFQWRFIQQNQPYTKDLLLSEERMTYMQQLNIDTGVQKTMLPYSQVADMSLALEAQKLVA